MRLIKTCGLKMSEYFFDTYAIIEIMKGNPDYSKFKEMTFVTTHLNLSEFYYSLLKEMNETEAKKIISALNMEFIELDYEIALESSSFRYAYKEKKLSYADCIGYIVACKNNLIFLTGDNGFEKIDNVEFVK